MKSIVLSAESHSAELEIDGIIFERGVPQLVDDAQAVAILRHPWFVEDHAEPDPSGGHGFVLSDVANSAEAATVDAHDTLPEPSDHF